MQRRTALQAVRGATATSAHALISTTLSECNMETVVVVGGGGGCWQGAGVMGRQGVWCHTVCVVSSMR